MSELGTTLMEVYLANARPGFETEPVIEASWDDVCHLAWDALQMVTPLADALEASGHLWLPEGAERLDDELIHMAESGAVAMKSDLAPSAIFELERRCRWVLIAAQLEHDSGHRLNLPAPQLASDEIRGNALFLYFIAGEGRSYPPSICTR